MCVCVYVYVHVTTRLFSFFLSPSTVVYQCQFQPTPLLLRALAVYVLWENASISPPPPLMAGRGGGRLGGGVNKGNSLSSSTVTRVDMLKASVSTRTPAQSLTVKALRESPSLSSYYIFLHVRVQGCVV